MSSTLVIRFYATKPPMARPKVDSRLQNIEKMEEKIESDIAEIKQVVTDMKNGNNGNNGSSNEDNEKIDCLCDETKEVTAQNG